MPYKDPARERESNRASVIKYRLLHPERRRESQRRWRHANNDREREMQKIYTRRYLGRHPDATAQHHNRRRARLLRVLGKHTRQEWRAKMRAIGRCVYCGNCRVRLVRDHVIPLALRGSDSIDNILPACGPCNSRKGSKLVRPKPKYMRNANPLSRRPTPSASSPDRSGEPAATLAPAEASAWSSGRPDGLP